MRLSDGGEEEHHLRGGRVQVVVHQRGQDRTSSVWGDRHMLTPHVSIPAMNCNVALRTHLYLVLLDLSADKGLISARRHR